MKRMTNKWYKTDGFYLNCDPECKKAKCEECPDLIKAVGCFADIEDILGDEYDLDHLRELMESDRDGRLIELPRKAENETYVELDMFDYWTEELIPQKVLDVMRDVFSDIYKYPLIGVTSLPFEEVQMKLREAETE